MRASDPAAWVWVVDVALYAGRWDACEESEQAACGKAGDQADLPAWAQWPAP